MADHISSGTAAGTIGETEFLRWLMDMEWNRLAPGQRLSQTALNRP